MRVRLTAPRFSLGTGLCEVADQTQAFLLLPLHPAGHHPCRDGGRDQDGDLQHVSEEVERSYRLVVGRDLEPDEEKEGEPAHGAEEPSLPRLA